MSPTDRDKQAASTCAHPIDGQFGLCVCLGVFALFPIVAIAALWLLER